MNCRHTENPPAYGDCAEQGWQGSAAADIRDLGRTGLGELAQRLGERPFRASQIARWLYQHDVEDIDGMSDVSAVLRRRLAQEWCVRRAAIEVSSTSTDGSCKVLVQFASGDAVETVHLPAARRTTVCLSSQTGCPMACVFCVTGRRGRGRTLGTGEILEQLLAIQRPQPAGAGLSRPTHVVFMGMGEPLLEPRPVIEAIRVLVWEHGFGYASRRITVSTCGIPDGIRALAESGLKPRLALSLNAPWESLRLSLMPKAPPLAEVVPALKQYAAATKATITLEYVLLEGINDTPSCARALSSLATNLACKINLIVFNDAGDGEFRASSPHRTRQFMEWLQPGPRAVTLRQSMGRDIAAACGQLAGGACTPSGPAVP
ncbi:23S rRNA (adenine(2503)-C(2))-methyltransferase RlmN [Candidatus Fermentibacteria bacterium]|nr:23S rRNA (adenine(2503)-C(2))-methyltransferase RlmN [Candidatus Fermentibacteria bacterium]